MGHLGFFGWDSLMGRDLVLFRRTHSVPGANREKTLNGFADRFQPMYAGANMGHPSKTTTLAIVT
jgi:hypothetical protein